MVNPKTKTKKKKINKIIKNKTIKVKEKTNTITIYDKNIISHNNYSIPIASKYSFDEEENQLKNLIKHEYKTIIDLKNDFYSYVNYYWIREKKNSDILDKIYYTQYDNFRITQHEVNESVIQLVNNYIKNNNNDITKELKNLFNSRIHENTEIFDKRIVQSINDVDYFIEKDDFYGLMAYLNRSEMTNIIAPIKWKMKPNIYNPKKDISTFETTDIPIYDISLFIDNENDSNEIKKNKNKFIKDYKINYLEKIFYKVNKLLSKSKHIDINNILSIGSQMAIIIVKSFTNNTNDNLIINNKESKNTYGFDWELFAKKLGYKNIPKQFLVTNSKYFKLIMNQLNTDWKSWRNWWIYVNLKYTLNVSKKYYPIFFNFYRKYLEGRGVFIPEKIIDLFGLSLCFNNLLNNLYKKNYTSIENINYTYQLSNDLKLVFIQLISNNKWMSSQTKKYAILKLKKLQIIIDSKKSLEKDPLLGYSKDDILLNIEKIYKWRLEKSIENDGKDVIDLININWRTLTISGKVTYIVNAFYIQNLNEIYIPLGILQKPFIDLNERGIIYDLSFIGYILAHELSHSMDGNGKKYGYDGKPYNWMSKKDNIIFEEKINNIKQQCKIFANLDNLKLNLDQIANETISDISALEICEAYLINFQTVKNFYVPVQIPSLKALYILFAMNLRQIILKKAYKYELLTNPHLMNKYRVNITLSRMKLFKDIYQIKKGDGMYWNTPPLW